MLSHPLLARRRTSLGRVVPLALAAALVLQAALLLGAPGPVLATSRSMTPSCAGVNLRAAAKTTGAVKVKLALGAKVTVIATITGGAWSAICPTAKRGATWYRISAVNGKSVRSLYGVAYIYAASGVLKAAAPATKTMAAACAGATLRTAAKTTGAVKIKLARGAKVTVSGTVSGGSWSATCPTAKHGSSWYRVTAVGGKSVKSLYGVSYLYAATGVLGAVAVPSPTPSPVASPSPTVAPSPSPSASASPSPTVPPPDVNAMTTACAGANLRTTASTSGSAAASLGLGATVLVDSTVGGGAWSTSCPDAKSGTSWYRITAVGGISVSSLYGVSYLYAATGVLVALPPPTPLPTSVTFYGRGYGHGVGLSQYGARGRAAAGQTAAEITAHYYQGTTLGPLSGTPSVRVLVLDNYAASAGTPLVIYGRGGTWSITGVAGDLPADGRATLTPTTIGAVTTWRLVVDLAGTVISDTTAGADIQMAGTAAATTFQVFSKPTSFDLFRGTLRVLPNGGLADVVNTVSLEDYLRGVVPAEMPSSWPAEALKAQALAARSYAAYHLHPATGTFDVYDDTRSQVYRGVHAELAATDAAIAATAGTVIKSGSATANAMFHSTGGGATEDNEYVYVSAAGVITSPPVTYLRGSSDRDGTGAAYDASSPYATWHTSTYTAADVSAIFAADGRTDVGTLTGLSLGYRGVSGRLINVSLFGTSGMRTVSGDVFVAVFNAHRPTADPLMMSSLVDLAPIP